MHLSADSFFCIFSPCLHRVERKLLRASHPVPLWALGTTRMEIPSKRDNKPATRTSQNNSSMFSMFSNKPKLLTRMPRTVTVPAGTNTATTSRNASMYWELAKGTWTALIQIFLLLPLMLKNTLNGTENSKRTIERRRGGADNQLLLLLQTDAMLTSWWKSLTARGGADPYEAY